MKTFKHYLQIIQEGGAKAGTGPIKREYIEPTLEAFKKDIKKHLPGLKFEYSKLGSAGHKPLSGDLDLALDSSELIDKNGKPTKESKIKPQDLKERFEKLKKSAKTATDGRLLVKAATQLLWEILNKTKMGQYLVDDDSKKVGGTLFFRYPQKNEKGKDTGEFVQIDLNIGNQKWLNFSYYSSPNIYSKEFVDKHGNLKGLHRTQLMLAIVAEAGYVFDHIAGVSKKETEEEKKQRKKSGKQKSPEFTEPEDVVMIINKRFPKMRLKIGDVDNYSTLMEKINRLDETDKEAILRRYLSILHSPGYEDVSKPKDLEDYIKKFGIVQQIRKSRQ